MPSNPNEVVARCKAAKQNYDGLFSELHRAIGDYFIPHKSAINTIKTPGTENWSEGIYDVTGIQSQITFSAGCYEYMLSGEWFDFRAPYEEGETNPVADEWYHRCAEIILQELNSSNFAAKIQEHLQDRNTFGTAHVDIEASQKPENTFNFYVCPVGKFYGFENDEGWVDDVFYRYEWTAKKIVDKFGKDNVSAEVRKVYDEQSTSPKQQQTFTVWREVSRRREDEREPGKQDGINKEWKSVWVEENAQHILHESGFDERPHVVSRFAQWGEEVWGWSPAVLSLPTVRVMQDIKRSLVALGEVKVWPRTLVPDTLRDSVDFSAGGVTVFPAATDKNALPQAWMDGGDYRVGADLLEQDRQMIKDNYHVDLFKALAERTKAMTATEVLELVEEKLLHFRPTFARFTSETLTPLLQRCFAVALRAGKLPPIPSEVVQRDTDGLSVPAPLPVFVSKIARALRALENRSILEFVQQVSMLLEIDPHLLSDNYDLDKMARQLGDNHSLPTAFKRSEEETRQIKERRQQQIEAQQAAELAKEGSEAARNASQVPQGDRKQLQDMMEQ